MNTNCNDILFIDTPTMPGRTVPIGQWRCHVLRSFLVMLIKSNEITQTFLKKISREKGRVRRAIFVIFSDACHPRWLTTFAVEY